jgi:predicted ATP-grasp superfamily ATP-dependent carboligase
MQLKALVSPFGSGRGFFMPDRPDLLILGASTRAAAFSAIRAGLRPCCLDLFADADLAASCPTTRLDALDDAAGLARAAARFGCSSCLYTGPLENHPALVERLRGSGRLLGNPADSLRAVRDPWQAAEAMTRAGLASPKLANPSDGPPGRGRWLCKPRASAGGRSISRDESPACPVGSFYYQEFIEGPTISALYLAAGGRASLLGVARQFHGVPGAPFLYRGGIAPWEVPDASRAILRRAGEALASRFALVGWFGVDFILRGDEPLPIEVNPRYTASVEIHELAMRRALLLDHVEACVDGRLPSDAEPSASRFVGKRVLYARRRLVAPAIAVPDRSADPFAVPDVADVPEPGTIIAPLEPIMTVFATASTFEACAERLDRIEEDWMRRL